MGYTATCRTTVTSRAALQKLEREASEQGLLVRDRAPSYISLGSRRAVPGGVTAAIAIGVILLLLVLGLTAVSPLFIVLLPFALLPAAPFLRNPRDSVTVAAFRTGEDTLVTADGDSTELVGRVIDRFMADLPSPTVSAEPSEVPAAVDASDEAVSVEEDKSANETDNGDDDTL